MWHQFKKSISTLNLNCQEACRAQSEALDHPLPPAKTVGLRLHLLICRWCRRYGKHIAILRETARRQEQASVKEPPVPLAPEARERMKHILKNGR